MNLEKFSLDICGKKIYFYTNSKKCVNSFIKELPILKTVPCKIAYCGKFESITEKNNVISYINSDSINVCIDKENNNSFLSLQEEKLFFPDLVYLSMCMFANIFQHEQKYFLQASVVKYNEDSSIMFLGDPGAGKTTLAYLLALDTGCSLVSNDNVLVGIEDNNFKTYAGSHIVQMRLGAIKLFCDDLLDEISVPKNSKDDMDTKIYINQILSKKGFTFYDDSVIKKIYFINTSKRSKTVIREKEDIDKTLMIYEHLTKQIRSNRYVLTSFDYPIPSYENEEYLQDRYDISKKIVENVEILEARGDIHKLVRKIEKRL